MGNSYVKQIQIKQQYNIADLQSSFLLDYLVDCLIG